jgi:hypothetical protein
MNKIHWLAITGTTALALAGLSAPATAGGNVSFGVFVGSPGYGAAFVAPPPVIYAPAPVYYTPPPRVVYYDYAPRPYYAAPPAYYQPGRHKGRGKHHHHH